MWTNVPYMNLIPIEGQIVASFKPQDKSTIPHLLCKASLALASKEIHNLH